MIAIKNLSGVDLMYRHYSRNVYTLLKGTTTGIRQAESPEEASNSSAWSQQ
jgi:hypothetical protein